MSAIDLAIVTSVHNYGQYLAEWAASIIDQQQRPAAVYLFQHGSTDDSAQQAEAALRTLVAAGIPARLEHAAQRLDFGTARNRACAMAGAHEWLMHFDADDTLMRHAIADIAAIAPHADVVALGYERSGDLKAGPRRRVRTYRSSVGPAALSSTAPASGVSPFRRRLWEQTPYRSDLIGGWDTALWRDFARQGARFIPTRRPVFWYRQHADSVFNQRRLSGWPAARAGAQLAACQRGDQGVTMIIPRAPDDGPERQAAWDWLKQRYAALYPTWQLLEGRGASGPWCKGAAVQEALRRARGRILILADADCILPAAALRDAVGLVERGAAPWVVPHTLVHRLSSAETATWLRREPTHEPIAPPRPDRLARPPYLGFAGGGLLVVNRAVYEASGGIPEAFVGWGGEDEALALVLDVLVGKHKRLPFPLIHLWHPPQPDRRGPGYRQNRQRVALVQAAARAGDAERLWALVRRLDGSHLQGQRYVLENRHPTPHRRGIDARRDQNSVQDDFVTRRRATARDRRRTAQEAPVAGALDFSRQQSIQNRKEQAERNREALEEQAKRQKARPARGVTARQQKAMPGAEQNKMVGSGATERKDRERDPHRRDGGDPLVGITFASPQAEQAAKDANLTAGHFAELEPGPQGFTAAAVRALAAQKPASTT